MNIPQLRSTIETSEPFKEYIAQHPKAYLVHVFVMRRGARHEHQLGYYNPETKDIGTFTTEPKVMLVGNDKGLGAEDDIPALDLEKTKISFEEALAKAEEIMKEHYSAHSVTQEICILQHLETQVWNLTLVSASFAMINIRIDAGNGAVISHEARSLMDLGEFMPGEKKPTEKK